MGGLCRLLRTANQWDLIRVRVPSVQRTVAKAPPTRPAATRRGGGHGYSTSTRIPQDVVLFRHDRTRFVRLLAAFCGAQTLFWTYLAHFAYTSLKGGGGGGGGGGGALKEPGKAAVAAGPLGLWDLGVNFGTSAWRYGFTGGCLAVGGGVLGLGVLFCRRSVSQVVLHQGGELVTVATQSPLGSRHGSRTTVPLARLACHAHRNESPSFIPLKIKDHKFYFLLDKDGTITNAKLFDVTVGAYRPL